jgi:uncharacterized protein (DUF4213/DUF364 family)
LEDGIVNLYETVRSSFGRVVARHDLLEETLTVQCRGLSVDEAIGNPLEQDYPIQFGKEQMVQAEFRNSLGQAFSCEVKQGQYTLREVLTLPLKDDWERAVFIASLNAVFASLGLVDHTVHCKDQEPARCAEHLPEIIPPGCKVGLFGLQPRFLEKLAELGEVRCVDLDPALIGSKKAGILVEDVAQTPAVLDWCDLALVTGSALVNGTFDVFAELTKPLYVFGTTGAGVAQILAAKRFCHLAK